MKNHEWRTRAWELHRKYSMDPTTISRRMKINYASVLQFIKDERERLGMEPYDRANTQVGREAHWKPQGG